MTHAIEVSARTVEEAIEKGLKELAIEKADAEIEVLDEGDAGGLFGFGRRDAVVRISNLNATEDVTEAEKANPDNIEITEEVTEDTPDQEEIEQKAVRFVANIMQSLGIHGKMSSFFDDEGILHLNIMGDNLGAAIGRRGETLDALEYLTILAINKNKEEYTRVSLDVGGYRERRSKSVVQNACHSAERVIKTGRKYRMKPMSSAERRQVHIALQDYAGVRTYSEGTEPDRCVVILPDQD